MKIQLKIEDNTTLKGYEVQDILAGTITVTNALFDSTGSIEFELIKTDDLILANGNAVYLYVNDAPVFKGYIFKYTITEKNTIKVTAYNQLRYLKVKDSTIIESNTASNIFKNLCEKFNIIYNIKDPSNVKIAGATYDNKSIYEILTDVIDQTLELSGKWYALIETFGVLNFVDLENPSNRLGIIVGDESLAVSYNYERSIDKDTYNQIKLTKDNKDTGKREIYIVKDSSTINKWGLLQYHESIDESNDKSYTSAQIQQRAENLLKVKNRETKTLKISCLGDLRFEVGKGIMVQIGDLNPYDVNSREYLITKVTHKITASEITSDLELQASYISSN